jgi:hypothetical protein
LNNSLPTKKIRSLFDKLRKAGRDGGKKIPGLNTFTGLIYFWPPEFAYLYNYISMWNTQFPSSRTKMFFIYNYSIYVPADSKSAGDFFSLARNAPLYSMFVQDKKKYHTLSESEANWLFLCPYI